jgi:hypothetical protein
MSERSWEAFGLMTTQQDVETAVVLGRDRVALIRELTVYATFDADSTAGVITVESAPHEDYTGTWASLGTITWAAADRCHALAITGVHLAVRIRISTAVSDGFVDIDAVGR